MLGSWTHELLLNSALKGGNLIFGKSQKKRFKEDDAFSETGIEIIMVGVNSLPEIWALGCAAVMQFFSGLTKIRAQVLYKFL